jgi:hypothetical protein
MLLLEAGSKILEESVREKISNISSGEKFIILLSDFDGVQFRFSTLFEAKKYFLISMRLACWKGNCGLKRRWADGSIHFLYGCFHFAFEPDIADPDPFPFITSDFMKSNLYSYFNNIFRPIFL